MDNKTLENKLEGILSQTTIEDLELIAGVMKNENFSTVDQAIKYIYKIENFTDFLQSM